MSQDESSSGLVPANRREFLHQAAGIAAVAALVPGAGAAPAAAPAATLPTVPLGPHNVSRLIVGGNPVYGYSHFNRLFSQHMTAWHTPDRVQELLRRCEQVGINTFQNSHAERTLQDVDCYCQAGGACTGCAWASPTGTSTRNTSMTRRGTGPSALRRTEPWPSVSIARTGSTF